MPHIRSSADLRDNYDEISALCHEHAEPVFIKEDGKSSLVAISIELYDQLTQQYKEAIGEMRAHIPRED